VRTVRASNIATIDDLRTAVQALADLPGDTRVVLRSEVCVGPDDFDWVIGALRVIEHESSGTPRVTLSS
jgi:hypothetical protein